LLNQCPGINESPAGLFIPAGLFACSKPGLAKVLKYKQLSKLCDPGVSGKPYKQSISRCIYDFVSGMLIASMFSAAFYFPGEMKSYIH